MSRQNPAKLLLCLLQHAKIIERAAAAYVAEGTRYLKAGGFEHRHSRLCGFRIKVIIERIGPENDGRLIFIAERLLA